ncbi:MAG TPA: transglycosylase SLT domain-containing protein [Acidimicrobiales bacterium]|nr:transglycosylase SLT domain-containing protein [Acidimicrobiales bacterium]
MTPDQMSEPLEAAPGEPRPAPRRSRRPRFRAVTVALCAVAVLGFSAVSCTPQEVAQVAVSNAFEPGQRDCAMRIVQRESNYQADALSPDWLNIGLFQINHVHSDWIRRTYGYEFKDLFDATKNARVARGLSDAAQSYYGDRWQPWRYGGQVIRNGPCPL